MKKNTEIAKSLRKNLTQQERKIWQILRNHQFYGYEIRRQYPISDYVVDFICREKKIIIEVDGGQHNQDNNIDNDVIRTKKLEKLGYKVIRFWNNDIDKNIEGVYQELKRVFGIDNAD